MKKINVGKAHWAAIIFWIVASYYGFFGRNNLDLFFSFYLLVLAWMLLYIFINKATQKMQKPLYLTTLHCILMLSSLILILAAYYILFFRLQPVNAVITAAAGNISMGIGAVITYREVKRSSN